MGRIEMNKDTVLKLAMVASFGILICWVSYQAGPQILREIVLHPVWTAVIVGAPVVYGLFKILQRKRRGGRL